MSSPTLQLSGSPGWLSRRRKIGFSFIAFGVLLLAIPLAARLLSLDWFRTKPIHVSVAQRKGAGVDNAMVRHYLIEINEPNTWLFTGLYVSPGETLSGSHETENKPIFALRLNGQEFKATGEPFGDVWRIQITDKKCNGCLFAKPDTHLYVSAEEPVVLRLEISK